MLPFPRTVHERDPGALALFPLHTVLFPGGLLPLRIFEQRYLSLVTSCLKDERPFGVCLIRKGDEVAGPAREMPAPEFAPIGTLARVVRCDVHEPGILHIGVEGKERFRVRTHAVERDGLVIGAVTPIAAEPAVAMPASYRPLADLLALLAEQLPAERFPAPHAFDNASWVGYRLAELMPLPLAIKQSMLEINDSLVRLAALAKFLRQQGLLPVPG
jgi:Lon protease-like protein